MSILSGILSGAEPESPVFSGTMTAAYQGSWSVSFTLRHRVLGGTKTNTWGAASTRTGRICPIPPSFYLWDDLVTLSEGRSLLMSLLQPPTSTRPHGLVESGRVTLDKESQSRLRVWMDGELEEGRAP